LKICTAVSQSLCYSTGICTEVKPVRACAGTTCCDCHRMTATGWMLLMSCCSDGLRTSVAGARRGDSGGPQGERGKSTGACGAAHDEAL